MTHAIPNWDYDQGENPPWFNAVTIPRLKDIPEACNKTISIIMCNWRFTSYLPSVISYIGRQQFPKDKYEIIVIDDNSNQKCVFHNPFREFTVNEVMFKIKDFWSDINLSFYQTNKNVTFNIVLAFNIGLKRAKNDLIVMNSADCWQQGEYLETASRYLSFFGQTTHRVAICGGVQREKGYQIPTPVKDLTMVANREDLLRIRGYDERFRGWGSQEPDICGRLGMSGVKFGYTPDLVMETDLGPDLTMKKYKVSHINQTQKKREVQGMGYQPDAPNGQLSNNNHDKRIIRPNGDDWGELDTLERIF